MATNYNYFGNLVTSGLVLNLDAAKVASYPGTGTTWYDISGNNLTGSLVNGPTFTGIGKQAAIVFDGTNDYVGLGTPNGLNITSSITINTWVNLNAFPSDTNATIYNKGYDNTNEQTFFSFNNQGGVNSLLCGTYVAIGNINYFTKLTLTGSFANLITTGSWNNLVGQYDGSSWNLYVNGTLLSQTTTQGPKPSTSPIAIGAAYISSGYQRFINGRISNVQVYNRALSTTEITQNFNALRGRYGI
jgi:hypothetical protein